MNSTLTRAVEAQTASQAPGRGRVAPLGWLTVAGLVTTSVAYLLVQIGIGESSPPIVIHIAVGLLLAAGVATGLRWTPALGALYGIFLVFELFTRLRPHLTDPEDALTFALAASMLAGAVVATGAGCGALFQNYRRPVAERSAPGWLPTALAAVIAAVVGGSIATAIHMPSASSSLDTAALTSLPSLEAQGYQFAVRRLDARVGQPVVLRLDNADPTTHYFEIDELNIHATMPIGKTGVTVFTPTAPGTYTYYCGPHFDKASGQGMSGTLVVAN